MARPSDFPPASGASDAIAAPTDPRDERIEVTCRAGYVRCNRISARGIQEPSVEVYRDGETRSFHAIDDHPRDAFAGSTANGVAWLRGEAEELVMDGPTAREVLVTLLAALARYVVYNDPRASAVVGAAWWTVPPVGPSPPRDGSRVRVVGLEGLDLFVEPDETDAPDDPPTPLGRPADATDPTQRPQERTDP